MRESIVSPEQETTVLRKSPSERKEIITQETRFVLFVLLFVVCTLILHLSAILIWKYKRLYNLIVLSDVIHNSDLLWCNREQVGGDKFLIK